MNKYFILFFLVIQTAQAAPFAQGDAMRGAQLFSHYNCSRCHKEMMGGDGSAIFTRPDHHVTSPDKLIAQIKFCSGNVGAHLTAQDEQDLAAHLNQHYYHFK
jgi:cytochrome c553